MTDQKKKPTDQTDPPDPFDPENLRASQDFGSAVAVKKVLTKVDCRKPSRFEWVRVNTDPKYRAESVALLEMREHRETFLILPQFVNTIPTRVDLFDIYTAVTRQGVVLLWRVKHVEHGTLGASWAESMIKAIEAAKESWVRIEANNPNSCYDLSFSMNVMAEPVWPAESMRDLLKLAFSNSLVDRADHPLILQLLGAE
jgi:hypothetical protein